MKFNKCARCGCFFTSQDQVCPNCKSMDEVDKQSLKNYLVDNEIPVNAESLSYNSGVSLKNINRYLDTKEFSTLKNAFKSSSPIIKL